MLDKHKQRDDFILANVDSNGKDLISVCGMFGRIELIYSHVETVINSFH